MKYYLKPSPLILLVVATILVASAGCKNTARGAGKDIEKVGEKIQEKTR